MQPGEQAGQLKEADVSNEQSISLTEPINIISAI